MKRTTVSERALILAPRGRDAAIAVTLLREAGIDAEPCPSLLDLVAGLDVGAAFAIVTEEALATSDVGPLSAWLGDQEEWSDLPFVLLTTGGGGLERNPAARRFLDLLGNVTFLERPFHPTTLVSLARSALRGRRRQYDARARLRALRDGEMRYRTLFENIDEGFAVIEFLDGPQGPLSDYVHVEANAAYAINSGLPDIVGKRLRDIVGEEADSWAETYRHVLLTGEPIRFERELVATGRHLELAAFRVEPIERRQVAVLFKDVTGRKRDEATLRELNETLESQVALRSAERDHLWNLSQDMLARADYKGMMSAVSPAWQRVLGWSEAELLTRPYATFMHPDDIPPTLNALARMGETGEPTRFENRIATKAGGFKPIEWTVSPEPDGMNFVAVGRDLSLTKARETELQVAQEALRQAQKMEAVGQLTGGVAHDFNNLLTIIKSSTDLLRRPGLQDERRRRYVDAISETVDRASKLTGQLLAFARRQALKPEVFDAGERIRAVADMLHTIMGSRVQILTDLPEARCLVEADASQFETALVNMAVNARDAMDGEGRLTVRVAAESAIPPIRGHAGSAGAFVVVSIADTGSGIAPDQLAHIFEPFFTTKAVGKGTGLGLSQVYGFAKQSGGDVAVDSEKGRGTTFTLYLPRAEPEAEERALDPAPRSGGAIVDGRGRRVLVVEDNVDVGTFSTQLLQDLGYETAWAANADEALDLLARADGFDAMFTDVIMPGMSGVELGHEVRRRHPDLPVVLTSGYSHVLAEEGRHGFELLKKPYAVEELSRVLRQAMRGPPTQR